MHPQFLPIRPLSYTASNPSIAVPTVHMNMEATSPDMYDSDDQGDHWEADVKHESQTSPAGLAGSSAQAQSKPQLPMQKRRRVTRACDECRRKKIKCDGKQPCTHCTVYSYGKHDLGGTLLSPRTRVLTLDRMHLRSALESPSQPRSAVYRGIGASGPSRRDVATNAHAGPQPQRPQH